MVLQDTWLFNGTIRDNIKYNNTKISDEEIMKACKVVGIDKFINSLPNGLSFEITDSQSISAGQKQLLTIARGMLKSAPFLILDEATSNVDTRTEELVQKASVFPACSNRRTATEEKKFFSFKAKPSWKKSFRFSARKAFFFKSRF